MAALHDSLTITIVDGDAPIATAEIEPDLDESGQITGQYKPWVEFRVLSYSLLPGFEPIRPVLRAATNAMDTLFRREDDLAPAERETLTLAMKAGEAIAERLAIHDTTGAPMDGRITQFHEWDYGADPLHSIGVAMALEYVQPPPRPRPPVVIRLRDATIESFVRGVFDHEMPEEGSKPWYFPFDVSFETDERRQLDFLAELFGNARALLADYSPDFVCQGLWCMMGGVHFESFTGLVWDPALPLDKRRAVIQSVYDLYDQLLGAYPYESVDFRHPDEDRRFNGIDYMVPDLLLSGQTTRGEVDADEVAVRAEFLDLFTRLLEHPAPVAQYAALHGLGHLEHPERAATIDRYLAARSWMDHDQREYALAARRGEVL
jgi:hypothetical protein